MVELTTKAKVWLVVTALLALLLLVFIVLNGEPVQVDLLVAEVGMSSAFLIIGSVLAGFVLGWSTRTFFHLRSRRSGK